MVRRGQQKKRQVIAADKAVQAELERQGEHGEYEPPDRSLCRYKQWYVAIDDSDTLRIETRIWQLDGRLSEFVITLKASTFGEWSETARIDCKHGHIHMHTVAHDTIVSIRRLDAIDDVQAGFEEASGMMDDLAVMVRDQREEEDA